jgi:hypothetical protein
VWVEFRLADEFVESRLTVPLLVPGLGQRFINAAGTVRPFLADGSFGMEIEHATIGRIGVPERFTQSVSEVVSEVLRGDRQVQNALASVASVEIAGGRLEIVGKSAPSPGSAVTSAPETTADSGDLTATARVYMEHLIGTTADLPEGDVRFLGLLQAAFGLARSRSRPETAVAENRAALVALGIQIGDPRVRHFAGFPAQERIPHFKYPFDRKVTLHGRNDLARHFLVSAALSALSGQDVSHAVGLLKEQLDSAQGGSGFSFADLAADLAGARFAQRATRTDEGARLLQDHVSQPIQVSDVLPRLDGLPEGLPDAEFREQFGSVDDPRFREMTAEIKSRLGTCPLLLEK